MSQDKFDEFICLDCNNKGLEFYYDTNPKNLIPLKDKQGRNITCQFGVVMTGEPGAERCMKCHSLNVQLTGELAEENNAC